MELPKWIRSLLPKKTIDLPNFSYREPTFNTTDIVDVFISTYNTLSPQNIDPRTVNSIYWKLRKYMEKMASANDLNLDPHGLLNIYQTDSGISIEGMANGEYTRIFRPKSPYTFIDDNRYMNNNTLFANDTASKLKCGLEIEYSMEPDPNDLSVVVEGSISGELLALRKIGGYTGNLFTLKHCYSYENEQVVPSLFERR